LAPPRLTDETTIARRIAPPASFFILALISGLAAAREAAVTTNPFSGNPAAIRAGAASFRINCGVCHGLNAGGGARGPSLTSNRWAHGGTDADIFRTITHGVPGTQMPANELDNEEVWKIIAYLRSLAASPERTAGDAGKGRALYESKGCPTCHMINGKGGVLGPELSRVGTARSSSYLIESIRNPDRQLSEAASDPNDHYGLPPPLDTVTVITRSGERISGIAKNEDAFSVQLLDGAQRLRLFDKADLADVVHEHRSLMPAFSPEVLDDAQLQDLVAYLRSLK
jgi:cytochrome c oxidase cbb3-type subunit III